MHRLCELLAALGLRGNGLGQYRIGANSVFDKSMPMDEFECR